MKEILVEIPNSDAYRVFKNMADVVAFLHCHDVNDSDHFSEFDSWNNHYIRVPKFAEGRERFRQAKSKECKVWGCE